MGERKKGVESVCAIFAQIIFLKRVVKLKTILLDEAEERIMNFGFLKSIKIGKAIRILN